MLTQPILNKENKEVGKMELKDSLFSAPLSQQLLFDCVRNYLANQRLGTAKAKARGEVHGTTKKMYRQKGTGQARHGSYKVNIFVGGGAAFPPQPRNWNYKLPQKLKNKALAQALSLRTQEGNLLLVDGLHCEETKTKKMVSQLKKWGFERGLIITDSFEDRLVKSLRNVPYVFVRTAQDVHGFDVLRSPKVLMTEKAVRCLEKRGL